MSSKKWEKFPPETIERLFQAVEEDDRVGSTASLPPSIEVQCSTESVRHCYALCLQFWQEGVHREDLLKLINLALQQGELNEKDQLRYKHIRARYKHLRFAQRLYGKKHESDFMFRLTTVYLGHFQDAIRHRGGGKIKLYGRLLKILLSAPVWRWVHYCLRNVTVDDASGFIHYRQQKIRMLKTMIASPTLTGERFHNVRKIISQQVSYYDTVRSIDPKHVDAAQLSGFLSNINGLMGDRHDEMVADELSGRKSYRESSPLAENIRQPVEQFVARYPL